MNKIEKQSRADYFKARREQIGQFNVSIDKGRLQALEIRLKQQNKTKTAWLREKIDEEVSKQEEATASPTTD